MSATAVPAVRQSVVVNVPIERAFHVFTDGMSTWWPLESHHIAEKPADAAVMEPRAGGRWFERAADGSECEWGRVLAWEPPNRIVLAWHLTSDWQFDPDPANASEVEVRFAEEGGKTRVELEHRALERYGDKAGEVRAAVSGPGGWPSLLEMFRDAAEAA
jgi:uncharacterized protein YndB with AHSA1/START domain